MRTLMYCAVNSNRLVRKSDIAQACNASENHLAQVVNTLAQHGIITTTRGRSGGICLAQESSQISVGKILRLFEAGLPFAECFAGGANQCPIEPCCRLRGALKTALAAFYGALDAITLDDLVDDNIGLHSLLSMGNSLNEQALRQNSPQISCNV